MDKKNPNLVFVFPDQMRGSAMGFLGDEPVITPNLDRFAGESLVLTQASATYPVCSPYRGMLMTGKYPHSNKVIGNCTSNTAPFNCELQETDTCWSDILSTKGYDLGYIGKWHLDSPRQPYIDCANNRGDLKWNEWCPPERRHGFGYWYSYGTYDFHTRPMYWTTNAAREGFHYVDEWGPIHETDLAIEYLENKDGSRRDPDRPFALVVAMNPPHMPYELVPQRYADLYADADIEQWCGRPDVPARGTRWGDYYRKHIKNYYAMITGVDQQFGRILSALRNEGLDDNTIVVFTSDHGNCLGIHDMISKSNHYDESMIVPFLIRWPGEIEPRRDDLLISAPDIYPTLLELMGYGSETPREVEGTGFASLFLGINEDSRPTSQLYMNIPYEAPDYGTRGVRTNTHTLTITIIPGQSTVVRLYDNVADPYQMVDISADNADLVEELATDELIGLLRAANDPWIRHIVS